MLEHNYGNLFYSLFRKEALFEKSVSFFSLLSQVSLNEIPFFLFVSLKGQWKVLSDIGFYKMTSNPTYAQARWEKKGGKLPNSKGIRYLKQLPHILSNHKLALKDIADAVDLLNVDEVSKRTLKRKAKRNIRKHFIYFILRKKSKLF